MYTIPKYLSSLSQSYVDSCTNCMLDEVIKKAIEYLPKGLEDSTQAKVYFFVLVNNELLFNNSVSLHIPLASFQNAKLTIINKLSERNAFWRDEISKIKISIGSKVSLLILGIGDNSKSSTGLLSLPMAENARMMIGLTSGVPDGSAGGLWEKLEEAQKSLTHTLSSKNIPGKKIPSVQEPREIVPVSIPF